MAKIFILSATELYKKFLEFRFRQTRSRNKQNKVIPIRLKIYHQVHMIPSEICYCRGLKPHEIYGEWIHFPGWKPHQNCFDFLLKMGLV